MISVRLTTRSSTTVLRLGDPDAAPASGEVWPSLSVSAQLSVWALVLPLTWQLESVTEAESP
jgi:hypothetical protein